MFNNSFSNSCSNAYLLLSVTYTFRKLYTSILLGIKKVKGVYITATEIMGYKEHGQTIDNTDIG